ncbi:hypothetical protein N0V82_003094 [Gnomoniopsis sp. IMI 355080]|nr:hypothetical protein N0V82_003094 [Gnomoniopsis sp. IMI 355080]
MDYEGELVVVLDEECKNLADRDEAFSKVLGYAVGNDVSSRWWQLPEQSGGQHGFAKSFDGFAPVGPVISAPQAIGGHGGVESLMLVTRFNGEERQRVRLDDLRFDVAEQLIHLSKGTTSRAGTLIMTGTPGSVSISGIGTIRSKFIEEQ